MRGFLLGLPAVALAVILAGCGGNTRPAGGPSPAPTDTPSSTPPASVAATAKIAVNETIRDNVLGHTIKVQGAVRNFPIPDRLPALQGNRELILVKFTLTAGTKYTGSLGAEDFVLVTDGGDDTNTSTSTVNAEMKAAGYKPLPEQGARPGQTATGWVAFMASVGSKTLTLRYKRQAANVIGSGKRIPAKNIDVPLVK